MARAIDADELLEFPLSESAGTDEQIADWIEECGLSDDENIDKAKKLCWMAIEGFVNVIKTAPTLTPPNDPLTQADVDKMHFDRVWIDYGVAEDGERCGEEGVVLYGRLYSIDTLEGAGFEDLLLDACYGETLDRPSGDYKLYRRPQEGEA